MMKRKFGTICIAAGILMILGSLFFFLRNIRESNQAGEYSERVLAALVQQIPEYSEPAGTTQTSAVLPGEDDLFQPYETQETVPQPPAEIVVDGRAYCGYISVPSVHIELPVLSSWSESELKAAPCRYSGAPEDGNLIVAGHNYRSHFGPLHSLRTGELIVFTDAAGRKFRYTVTEKEIIDGSDAAGMNGGADGNWDLTLFTCTLGGQSRVTVRARLVGSAS